MKRLPFACVLACFVCALLVSGPGRTDDQKPKGVSVKEPAEAVAFLQKANLKEPKEDGTRKKQRKIRRRLPNYYGQVGVSPAQREKIYSIQATYREKLEELEKQLLALREQQDMEIEAVLTDEQRERLKQLVQEAEKKRRSRKTKKAAASD